MQKTQPVNGNAKTRDKAWAVMVQELSVRDAVQCQPGTKKDLPKEVLLVPIHPR